MSFLNPFVLFALAAAAIPLIIHLINLRKPRKVNFSSLAFLQELRQQTIRRLRVKQWLLLALRTLAVAALVLAFARPTVKSPAIARLSADQKSVVVVLDNSLSMDLRDQGGSYFSQAVDLVNGLAGEMGPSDELAVIPLVDDGVPHSLGQPRLVDARLAEMNPAHGRAHLASALRGASSTLAEARNPAREIYLISDLQKTNFADSATVDLGDKTPVVVIPVGERSVDNVAVTAAQVVSSIVEVNQPATIVVEVRNFGAQPVRNWGVSVYLEEERVAQSTVTLEPGQSGELSVVVTPRSRGWLRGRVTLEEDGFVYDNERFFTLHVPEDRRVLVVRGSGRDAEFLDLALSTRLRDGGSLFETDYIDEDAVSGAFSEDYDAVILLGLRRITPGLATAVTTFLEDGGGVFLFAGETASDGTYNELLEQVGAGSFQGMAVAPDGSNLATLSRLDREHPLFQSVFEDDESDRTIERPSLKKLIKYIPGSGDEQTLLGTSIGLPMLQEVRHAAGRMLIAPFVLEPDWTDLPVRGLFVPLLFRSMYYLTSSDDPSGSGSQLRPGSTFRVASKRGGARLKIVSSSGQEWIPEQRVSPQGVFFTIPLTLQTPGTYDVMGDEGLLQRFAVNLDQSESNLDRFEFAEAADRFEQLTGVAPSILQLGTSDATLSERIRTQETGVEIWNVFLAIALVLLVTEMLVAARWKPAGAPQVST